MATTVEIPGGTAVMLDKREEMTGRRSRPIEIISSRIGTQKLSMLMRAAIIRVDGGIVEDRSDLRKDSGEPVFEGEVDLTEKDYELLWDLGDATGWALLKSWTLDLPLPASVPEFRELPTDLVSALRLHAAVLNAQISVDGGFTVDSLPDDPAEPADPALPTSA